MHQIGVPRGVAPSRGCRGGGPPLPPAAQATDILYTKHSLPPAMQATDIPLNARTATSLSTQAEAILAIKTLQQALQYNPLLNNLA